MAIITAPHRSGHAAHHGQPMLIAVLIAALAVVAGVITLLAYGSSGAAATQTRTVASFTSLDLAGSNNVTVIVGRAQSVVVHADSNLINHVTTDVVAGTLVIGDTGSFTASGPMSVDVSVPSLTALSLTRKLCDAAGSCSGLDVLQGVRGSLRAQGPSAAGKGPAAGALTVVPLCYR